MYTQGTASGGPVVGVSGRKRRTGLWVGLGLGGLALVLVACLFGLVVVGGSSKKFETNPNLSNPGSSASVSSAKVQLVKCDGSKARETLLPEVRVEYLLTNTSKDQKSYLVDVFVFVGSDRVADTVSVLSNVRPGQAVRQLEVMPLSGPASGAVRCQIDKVQG